MSYLRPFVLAAVALIVTPNPRVLAQTEVYSNIVGYQRLDVPSNGFALVSTPFDAGTNASVQEVIGPQLTGGLSWSSSDRIKIWDPQAGSFIRLYQAASGNPAVDGKWIDTTGETLAIATNDIQSGMGFWFQSTHESNQTVVVVGDIVTTDVVTNTVVPGLQILSYPYSTDILLNSSGLTNGNPGASWSSADKVRIWDAQTREYKRYYLLDSGNPIIHRKWIDISGTPIVATNHLHTGEGFWYESLGSNSFEWVEARPYALP